jgi:methyl-accepting chemotaxis protein
MNLSVRAKIVLITLVILAVVFGVNGVQSRQFFWDEYSEAIISNAFTIGDSLKIQLNRILKLGIELENIVGFEEQCKEMAENYEYVSHVLVMDMEGVILFHNNPGMHGKKVSPTMMEAIGNGEDRVQHFTHEYGDHYDVIVPVSGSHETRVGFILVGIPIEFINQKTSAIMYSYIILAVASFLIASLLIIVSISKWVTTPIGRLRDSALLIGRGKLDVKIETKSRDELGELSSAFNQMREGLKESRKKLESYSKELEKEVKERTAELERSKKDLESKNDELERFNKLAIGRELKMVELKKRIKELEGK